MAFWTLPSSHFQGRALKLLQGFWFINWTSNPLEMLNLAKLLHLTNLDFPEIKVISLNKTTIWGENSCEVAIIWPGWMVSFQLQNVLWMPTAMPRCRFLRLLELFLQLLPLLLFQLQSLLLLLEKLTEKRKHRKVTLPETNIAPE